MTITPEILQSGPWYLGYDAEFRQFFVESDTYELGVGFSKDLSSFLLAIEVNRNLGWAIDFPSGEYTESGTLFERLEYDNKGNLLTILHTFPTLADFFNGPQTHPELFL